MAKSRQRRVPGQTRKHLARVERERRQSRMIVGGTVAAVVLALGLLGFGYAQLNLIQPRQPVARVGETEISTRDFQQAVKYRRLQLVRNYRRTQQMMQFFGADENTQAIFQNQLNQVQLQLANVQSLGREVLNQLIDDELIRQEAQRRGITVSADEVEARLQASFGYYPGGTPTPTTTPTREPTGVISPTPTLSATELAGITPTATLTPTATATAGPTPTVTATGTPPPTATPYTAEAFQADLEGTLSSLGEAIGMKEADFRRTFEAQLYRDKVFDAITASVSREQEQVRASHILLQDEETAGMVRVRLDAGEDFAALAAELSTDLSNKDEGGDLGWFGLGRMVPEFEKVAFNMSVGEISEPVQSQFGWHIILVTGHEMRSVSDAEYEQLRQTEFDRWLQEQRNSDLVVILDTWADRVPAEPSLPQGAGQLPGG